MDFGFTDKESSGVGLQWQKNNTNRITVNTDLLFIDSRDLVQDPRDIIFEQNLAAFNLGAHPQLNIKITNCTGKGVPIEVTLETTSRLKVGDEVFISQIVGNTAANEMNIIESINGNTIKLKNKVGNGDYKGGGLLIKKKTTNYPQPNSSDSRIIGNEMYINIPQTFDNVTSVGIEYISLPRDIVPITSYIPDLVKIGSNYFLDIYNYYRVDNSYNLNSYPSWVPYPPEMYEFYAKGFYSTPLEFLRTYMYGDYSMPDQYTPPPLELWNPPQGDWPNGQPQPYPYQTVPTYKSRDFDYLNKTVYIICSGYGVYDLADFTVVPDPPSVTVEDARNETAAIRNILLANIIPYTIINGNRTLDIAFSTQYITGKFTGDVWDNDIPYKDPDTDELLFFGFGAFQRFIPGPGVGMAYQPGKQYPEDPTVASDSSPIPFPNFRGNVWGPYDGPGARFQKMSLRDTLQDLYLNGDTLNILGLPVINPLKKFSEYFRDLNMVYNNNYQTMTFNNFEQSVNPNILNAMRIVSNGFGASSEVVNSDGSINIEKYKNAGGIGPSQEGPSRGWVNNPVNGTNANFGDPIAAGPSTSTTIPQYVDASYPGNDNSITHRISWYDRGTGDFINQMRNYRDYLIQAMTPQDVVIEIQQVQKNYRTQHLNPYAQDCIFTIPIRLSPGVQTGTNDYVEAVQTVIADSEGYWTKRFHPSIGKLQKLNIKFTTGNGDPIILSNVINMYKNVNSLARPSNNIMGYQITPYVSNRSSTNITIVINILHYEYENPGLINSIKRTLGFSPKNSFLSLNGNENSIDNE